MKEKFKNNSEILVNFLECKVNLKKILYLKKEIKKILNKNKINFLKEDQKVFGKTKRNDFNLYSFKFPFSNSYMAREKIS